MTSLTSNPMPHEFGSLLSGGLIATAVAVEARQRTEGDVTGRSGGS